MAFQTLLVCSEGSQNTGQKYALELVEVEETLVLFLVSVLFWTHEPALIDCDLTLSVFFSALIFPAGSTLDHSDDFPDRVSPFL